MSGALAWWVGPVNGLLAPATRRGCRSPERSFAALEERAARRAGVAGPVEPAEAEFAADLRVLYESFLAARELSFSGLFGARLEVFRHLRNGLRVRALVRAHPEIAEAPVRQPVFVTGLPRTGTTALHALLAAVPGHRAPLMWELLEPCPPDAGRRRADRRPRNAEWMASATYRMAPVFRVIHPLDARGPEECVFALPHSMLHYSRARIPGYRDWYARRDATPDYAYLRQQLQVLQWRQPPRRWILKTPFHLWNLDALMRVFPDATIVWTHRDPAVALASWCSLTEVNMRLHNQRVDLAQVGRDWVQLWAQAAGRAAQVRRTAARSFLDVWQTQLAAGPWPALEPVLAGLGVEPTPATRQQIAGLGPGSAAPNAHRYGLERYGLTAQGVRGAFPGLTAAAG
jgi:sulfotransferase family protein